MSSRMKQPRSRKQKNPIGSCVPWATALIVVACTEHALIAAVPAALPAILYSLWESFMEFCR